MTTRPTRRRLGTTTAYIPAAPVSNADFRSTTRVGWDSLSSANPDVAAYLMREARLLAMGFLGLTLVVAVEARGLL